MRVCETKVSVYVCELCVGICHRQLEKNVRICVCTRIMYVAQSTSVEGKLGYVQTINAYDTDS